MSSEASPPFFLRPRDQARARVDGSPPRATARWVRARLGTIAHERRVRELTDALFVLLRPIHGLGASARRVLRLAALVHDVGRAVDERRHPQIGAGLLLRDRKLPFGPRQRRWLAYLTRYHRGAVPRRGFDEILAPDDPHNTLRILLALLRAGDALDGRQHHPPSVRFKLRGRRLKVRVGLTDDSRKARRFFSRRKKFRLLEELLDVQVAVTVKLAGAIA